MLQYSELSHGAQNVVIYLENTREIYDAYIIPARDLIKGGDIYGAINRCVFAVIAAAKLVKKREKLSVTVDEILQIAGYCVEWVQMEVA